MDNYLANFLLRNGLKRKSENIFINTKCEVTILDNCIEIYDVEIDGKIYSPDLQIYWLIGFLTYNNFIDKNYK